MICKLAINNLRISCPLDHPSCWDAHVSWSREEKAVIITERRVWCEKCERNAENQKTETIEPAKTIEQENPESEKIDQEQIDRIAGYVGICRMCDKAMMRMCAATEGHPELITNLGEAFIWAQHRLGISGLRCDKFGSCCGRHLAAMKNGECERWVQSRER